MCGIVGAVGYGPLSVKLREDAMRSLQHRGPDDSGSYYHESLNLFLGHKRLSIFGITNGHQPVFSEKQDIITVANGEFYEYPKLRAYLEKNGHRFSTGSDSELLIHLYQEHGLKLMFPYLNGEFAFAIFDHTKNKLILARDRFGIKPLFYAKLQKSGLVFGSEAKAIFATELLRPSITTDSLLAMEWFDETESPFERIATVQPGSYVEFCLETGDLKIETYYDIKSHLETGQSAIIDDYRDAVTKVRGEIKKAVEERMQSDVPVGVFLSGGLDSSIVAAEVANLTRDRVKTFSIGFSDDGGFDESKIAKRTAEHLETDHHELRISNRDLINHLEEAIYFYERPLVNLHAVGKFLLSRLAHKYVKVVLTGEGADELFLGYPYLQNLPDPWFRVKKRRFLYQNASKPCPKFKDNDLSRQIFAFKQLKTYILSVLGDRNEMAHSLEGRPPFLSHNVFELSCRIPRALKLNDKNLLRDAFRQSLTVEVYKRKKWRFAAPVQKIGIGINDTLDRLVVQYLSNAAIKKTKIFRPWFVSCMKVIQFLPVGRFSRSASVVLLYILTTQILIKKFKYETNSNAKD